MYGYYAEIEEAERNIALYVYGTEDIDFYQARALQRYFNVSDVIQLYDMYKDWKTAIGKYIEEHDIRHIDYVTDLYQIR